MSTSVSTTSPEDSPKEAEPEIVNLPDVSKPCREQTLW